MDDSSIFVEQMKYIEDRDNTLPTNSLNVSNYKFNYDEIVNTGLRTGCLSYDGEQLRKLMDDYLDNIPPITEDIVIYRGLANFVPEVGQDIIEHGYSSFSTNIDVAGIFASYGDTNSILKIKLPRNSRVLFFYFEKEVVLHRGLKLHVLNNNENIFECKILGWDRSYPIEYAPILDECYEQLRQQLKNKVDKVIIIKYPKEGRYMYELINVEGMVDFVFDNKFFFAKFLQHKIWWVETDIPNTQDIIYRVGLHFFQYLSPSNLEKVYNSITPYYLNEDDLTIGKIKIPKYSYYTVE